MENTSTSATGRTITIIDEQGRKVSMTAQQPSSPAVVVQKTVEDTNITHKILGEDGVVRETAITLRDDSVQEIFERVPALLTRFGSGLVLGVLVTVLTVMAFVQFPKTIMATTTLRIAPGETNNDISRLQSLLEQSRRTSEELYIPLPEKALRLDPVLIPYQEFLLAYEAYLDNKDRNLMLVALRKLDQLEVALKDWQANQLPAAAVVGTYFAALELPVAATTNLELGQRINLELAKYPVGQYGRLSGVVSYIQPPLTLEGNYRVIVDLPQNLSMSKGDTIEFENGLLANATIMTENVSLLTKILRR